ncbi:MAG: hypothetical protein LPD71_10490 [Shewanella sp.]|nr:hypothetical protein [Shewanella sp.]MCF1432134.1 hypothetical protein [Shewanella sp.]MCF1439145.1 hypothetical protein [Shewanella sp.]MCF1457558.1 hypothetical protein [Shewanella sp.]
MAKLKASIKRCIKPLLAVITPVLLFIAISVPDSSDSAINQACVCDSTVSYDTTLPASHPKNLCASERQDVSWIGWLTGQNSTSQFHFVDLFELLYKKHGNPAKKLPSTMG